MKLWVAAALLAWPGAALGQFFDDFNGPALLPHWNPGSPPAHWAYDFSGGMLNVTGLFHPSLPKVGSNNAYMTAFFPQLGEDFVASVRMGWDAGDGRGMSVVVGNEITALGRFGVTEQMAGGPVIFGSTGTSALNLATAPPAGMHEFQIVGTGSSVSFILNGSLLWVLPRPPGGGPNSVGFAFISDYPNPLFAPLRVDFVQVLPNPSTVLALATGLWILGVPRRRP